MCWLCGRTAYFLSNGPGDPAAVNYAVMTIRQLLDADTPVFGICMGHQLLSQALGLSTFKLKFGHRGGNHRSRMKSREKLRSPVRIMDSQCLMMAFRSMWKLPTALYLTVLLKVYV